MDIARIYLHINDTLNNPNSYCNNIPSQYENQLQYQLQTYSHYLPKPSYSSYYINYQNMIYSNAYNNLLRERQRQEQQYIKDAIRRQKKMNYYYKNYISPMYKDIDAFRKEMSNNLKQIEEENDNKINEYPDIENEINTQFDKVNEKFKQRNDIIMDMSSKPVDMFVKTAEGIDKFMENKTLEKELKQMSYPKEGFNNAIDGIYKKIDKLHDNVYERKGKIKDVVDKCIYKEILKDDLENELNKVKKRNTINRSFSQMKQRYKRQYDYDLLRQRFRNVAQFVDKEE